MTWVGAIFQVTGKPRWKRKKLVSACGERTPTAIINTSQDPLSHREKSVSMELPLRENAMPHAQHEPPRFAEPAPGEGCYPFAWWIINLGGQGPAGLRWGSHHHPQAKTNSPSIVKGSVTRDSTRPMRGIAHNSPALSLHRLRRNLPCEAPPLALRGGQCAAHWSV